jgi:isopenicillin-N N-acyltransferase-like protein
MSVRIERQQARWETLMQSLGNSSARAAALTRRSFLRQAAVGGVWAAGAPGAASKASAQADTAVRTISGEPWQRGFAYGRQFAGPIMSFFQVEIFDAYVRKPVPREDLLRYASECAETVRTYSPVTYEELRGMAEGAGLPLEQMVLLTLLEELPKTRKRGVPVPGHCTPLAAGPPDTVDGHTFVAQTWDWMKSTLGLSSMLQWERPEGPSLLTYAYPGLWASAGLNTAGVGLTWASVGPIDNSGPAIGIPTNVLLAHLLYQPTLEDAMREVQRVPRAGWSILMMGDAQGNLACIEVSPQVVAFERKRGHIARDNAYRTPELFRAWALNNPDLQGRYEKANALLAQGAGKIDTAYIQRMYADTTQGIGRGVTLDMIILDLTARQACISRGPMYGVKWHRFSFSKLS